MGVLVEVHLTAASDTDMYGGAIYSMGWVKCHMVRQTILHMHIYLSQTDDSVLLA